MSVSRHKDDTIYKVVDKPASFPGGNTELYKFIGSNFKYPLEAKRTNFSGRVFLKFVVEKDGTVSNIENIQSIGFGIDEEAIRVIKLIPKWEAAE
ncbi:TonB family C-terminal domain-containing protein [Spirosomataceae bacterium TFI 002]|nr:TonB family C-terminal domain-containing protein [Spirosomataceae bacterium TFI 002]